MSHHIRSHNRPNPTSSLRRQLEGVEPLAGSTLFLALSLFCFSARMRMRAASPSPSRGRVLLPPGVEVPEGEAEPLGEPLPLPLPPPGAEVAAWRAAALPSAMAESVLSSEACAQDSD